MNIKNLPDLDLPIPRSVRYGVSDLQTYRVECPKCGAKPRQDCALPGGGQRNRRQMHADRYKMAASIKKQ